MHVIIDKCVRTFVQHHSPFTIHHKRVMTQSMHIDGGRSSIQSSCYICSQPAALRHNDCGHVARVLLRLPADHAPRLQQLLGSSSLSFAAPAARLARAGNGCIDAMVSCHLCGRRGVNLIGGKG